MPELILYPPIAFIIYIALIGVVILLVRKFSTRAEISLHKSSTYSSGEAPPRHLAAPGYRPFFVVALFFTIVHLGSLVLSSGERLTTSAAYLFGLLFILLALILG